MTVVSTIFAAWLGSMFLYSAGLKFADYPRSAQNVVNYRLLPVPLGTAAGLALPWVELVAAVALLSAPASRTGQAIATGLGLIFVASSASVIARKIDVACGCAGSTSGASSGVITCLRGCTIVIAGFSLMFERANAMPTVVLAMVVALSLTPAMISFGYRIVAARHVRLANRLHQRGVAQLLRLLALPLPEPDSRH